jgi:hypothetical protein
MILLFREETWIHPKFQRGNPNSYRTRPLFPVEVEAHLKQAAAKFLGQVRLT